jgi:hypothetical protein
VSYSVFLRICIAKSQISTISNILMSKYTKLLTVEFRVSGYFQKQVFKLPFNYGSIIGCKNLASAAAAIDLNLALLLKYVVKIES